MRELTDAMTFFEAKPNNELLKNREENEAYCRALPGKDYAIYFPDGGEVTLDLAGMSAKFTVRWLNIMECKWQNSKPVKGGKAITLKSPGTGPWVVLIEKT